MLVIRSHTVLRKGHTGNNIVHYEHLQPLTDATRGQP